MISRLTRRSAKKSGRVAIPQKRGQTVCAFANDVANHNAPGVLFVGAKDTGDPSRLLIDDQLLLTLTDIQTDGKIVPPPTLDWRGIPSLTCRCQTGKGPLLATLF